MSTIHWVYSCSHSAAGGEILPTTGPPVRGRLMSCLQLHIQPGGQRSSGAHSGRPPQCALGRGTCPSPVLTRAGPQGSSRATINLVSFLKRMIFCCRTALTCFCPLSWFIHVFVQLQQESLGAYSEHQGCAEAGPRARVEAAV